MVWGIGANNVDSLSYCPVYKVLIVCDEHWVCLATGFSWPAAKQPMAREQRTEITTRRRERRIFHREQLGDLPPSSSVNTGISK